MSEQKSKIILALDFSEEKPMFELVEQLQPSQCRLKVGKELFTRFGPSIVKKLVTRGFDVFLDLKFHDIPNTVAQACLAAADLGVWMVNVHVLGGRRMLEAARKSLDKLTSRPLLIGVTILTSMDEEELATIGINEPIQQVAARLGELAHSEGLDGIVCSALEVECLRKRFGPDFCLVTPGIRTKEDAHGDQRRVMTPEDAVKAGSSYLVMGRAITGADDPAEKLQRINQELINSSL